MSQTVAEKKYLGPTEPYIQQDNLKPINCLKTNSIVLS